MNRPQPGDFLSFVSNPNDGYTAVSIEADGLTFRLPDGRVLVALPHNDDPNYVARATLLGYSTALEMCQEHDLLHARLAHALGLPVSPALLAAADGGPMTEITAAEEAMVLAAARFLNLARKACGL